MLLAVSLCGPARETSEDLRRVLAESLGAASFLSISEMRLWRSKQLDCFLTG